MFWYWLLIDSSSFTDYGMPKRLRFATRFIARFGAKNVAICDATAIFEAIYRAVWVPTMKATSQNANRRRFVAKRQCAYNTAICDAIRVLQCRFWIWKNHLFLRRRAIWPYQIFIKCSHARSSDKKSTVGVHSLIFWVFFIDLSSLFFHKYS